MGQQHLRRSATLLAATALPSIFGRHAFWEADDADEKARRRTGALTDLGLAGGVLLAAGAPEPTLLRTNSKQIHMGSHLVLILVLVL